MREHGEFTIHLVGQRLLWVVVRGAINRECAEAYRDQVGAAAAQLQGHPWVRVSDIRHWQLCGPEAIPPLNQLMVQCEAGGLAHSINIVSMENLQAHLLNLMMAGVERHSERHLTRDLAQTLNLLTALGETVPSPEQLALIYPQGDG